MVESPAVKVRIAKELAARQADTQQFDAARETLNAAAGYAPAEMAAAVTRWKKSVDDLEAAHVKMQADIAAAAKKAHVDKLRERREQASAAGNIDAVSRYDALIEAAEGQ